MGKHLPDGATYFRNRRRAQRRIEREAGEPSTLGNGGEPFNTPAILQNSADLRLMEQLPMLEWPSDLFGQYIPIATLASAATGKHNAETYCACNCGQLHHNNVSLTTRAPVGTGWHVLYFLTDSHKSKYVREHANAKR